MTDVLKSRPHSPSPAKQWRPTLKPDSAPPAAKRPPDEPPRHDARRRWSSLRGECSASGAAEFTESEGDEEAFVSDEIVARLEDLRLGAAEPTLSEEQLRINDQLQQYELLALEAIYGENVIHLNKMSGLRMFQINVVNEVPREYNVSALLTSFAESSTDLRGESSDNLNFDQEKFVYRFNVQFLPPLRFTCLLPSSYPSHSSPHFTIYADWLNSSKISVLCAMLDKIWLEQPGQEVLYQWIEWLHISALSSLKFDGEVYLGPYDSIADDENSRAFSGVVSPDVDIPNMMRFNELKCSELFMKSLHDCCICFSEYAGSNFVKLPCKHSFCNKCMRTYVSIHVKEGNIHKLVCPDDKCKELLTPGLLKKLLGTGAFERWESLLFQRTLDSMDDVVQCPKCQTPCIEDKNHDAQCIRCFFSFCTICNDRRHVGEKCTPEMTLEALKARQLSPDVSEIKKRKELEKINNMLSMEEILRNAKRCPKCKAAISRISGCNKMTCRFCSQFFCYGCGKAINGYDHFRNASCQLFDPEAILQWERLINGRGNFDRNRNRAVLNAPQCRCAHCGKSNVKIRGNNHIRCSSCRKFFCALCLNRVPQRAALHFGGRGCQQYTRD